VIPVVDVVDAAAVAGVEAVVALQGEILLLTAPILLEALLQSMAAPPRHQRAPMVQILPSLGVPTMPLLLPLNLPMYPLTTLMKLPSVLPPRRPNLPLHPLLLHGDLTPYPKRPQSLSRQLKCVHVLLSMAHLIFRNRKHP